MTLMSVPEQSNSDRSQASSEKHVASKVSGSTSTDADEANEKSRVSVYSYGDDSSQISDEFEHYAINPLPRLRKKWRSALLDRDEPYEKPWLSEKEPKKMWERVIFIFGCLCGTGLGVYLCIHAAFKSPHHDVGSVSHHVFIPHAEIF